MKKLAILFSMIFVTGLLAASAQTSAVSDKKDVKTENVKSDDGAKAKGCCAYSSKSCKAGSMKCCTKTKAEKSCGEKSSKAEAMSSEKREEATVPDNSR